MVAGDKFRTLAEAALFERVDAKLVTVHVVDVLLADSFTSSDMSINSGTALLASTGQPKGKEPLNNVPHRIKGLSNH